MQTNTTIKFGFTFDFFIPGVLIIILGGISFFADVLIAIAVLFLGISLLLLGSGIEIDPDNNRIRKFYNFFPLRFGSWINTTYFPKVVLKRTNESQTMQSRGGQKTYETKTYDIVFIDNYGAFRELNDFKNYDNAVQMLELISKKLSLECRNEVQEIREAALKRRNEKNYKR